MVLKLGVITPWIIWYFWGVQVVQKVGLPALHYLFFPFFDFFPPLGGHAFVLQERTGPNCLRTTGLLAQTPEVLECKIQGRGGRVQSRVEIHGYFVLNSSGLVQS